MNAIDFFCGAGGLTRGLLDAGINVVSGFDIDEECRETYEHNNGATFHATDIQNIDLKTLKSLSRLRKFDNTLFAGCAPCQPFSQQRKSGSPHHSSTLLSHFGRLIQEAQPKAVVVENVPGMARVKGFSTFRRFLRSLDAAGYQYKYGVLDAKKFGVPQTRRRLVLIAIRKCKASIPKPTHGQYLRPFRTVRDAISHFPKISAGETHDKIANHSTASISDLNLKRLHHIPPDGGDRRDWPDHLQLKCHSNGTGGHTDVYGRMAWDSPSPTLTARCHSISNGRYGHPVQDRAISLREAAALQSFPDNYKFFSSNKHIAQQIGNAVPVRFATAVGIHVMSLQ